MGKSISWAVACWLLLASPTWAKDKHKPGNLLGAIIGLFDNFKDKMKEKKEDWQARQAEKQAKKERENQEAKNAWQALQAKKREETEHKKEEWRAKEKEGKNKTGEEEHQAKKDKTKEDKPFGIQITDVPENEPGRENPEQGPGGSSPTEGKEDPKDAQDNQGEGLGKGSQELVEKSKELADIKDLNEKSDVPATVTGVVVSKPFPPPPPSVIQQPRPELLAMSAALNSKEKSFDPLDEPVAPPEGLANLEDLPSDVPVKMPEGPASPEELPRNISVKVPDMKPNLTPQDQGLLSVRSAKEKLDRNDNQGALEAATDAVQKDPKNPEGYVRRAEANIKLGNYVAAEKDSRDAIRLNASYAPAYKSLAWVQMKKKDFLGGAGSLETALRLKPKDADSHAALSKAYNDMGRTNDALNEMKTASDIDPRYRDNYKFLLDQSSSLPSMVTAALGKRSPWRLPLLAGAGLLAAGAAAVALRRKKAPALGISQGPQAAANGRLGGKYEDLRVIGRGGMGTVYEATDHSLGRSVAIKKVSEDMADIGPQAKEMLLKEARTVASLDHPAIVEIYEIFEEGTNLYVVFELVKGKTVAHLLAERSRLGLKECLNILRPVCEALEFAHGREVVHRDLKPANIMVTESGQVKLMDFGIARSVADAVPVAGAQGQPSSAWQARTRTVAGTPAYMAPEAEQGLVSRGTDIYALGVCLYEFATGRPPFPPEASLMQRLGTRIAPPSELDPALASIDALVLQALEPQPDKRPQSAAAFLSQLEASIQGQPVRSA
jgi:tetratricopeptide (TPR) repeat protein